MGRAEVGSRDGIGALEREMSERLAPVPADEAAADELEQTLQASRAKSEFLSKMSHELRTPLNVILGFSQLLLGDDIAAEVRDGVEQIERAGRHLLNLINEILDISRIESGRIALSVEPVELGLIVREVLSLLAPLAGGRSISLTVSGTDGVYVAADRQRLRQVLLNLVTNAVKYNSDGGDVGIEAGRTTTGQVRVSVVDTGPGIPEERLDQLFAPFERLGAGERGIEGTGLGLALSKGLTEAMGGTIGVASVVGHGSTFFVELDESREPAADAEREGLLTTWPVAAGRDHTILYVEDNESNTRLIQQVMSRRGGTRLLVATHGREALEIALEERPDVVLLDLNLPDMHGSSVLRVLRHSEETRDIPVIVVSADATAQQQRAILEGGADAYLTKPLDLVEFRETLDRVLT